MIDQLYRSAPHTTGAADSRTQIPKTQISKR